VIQFSVFSVLDYYNDGSRSFSELYEQQLEQIVVAEQLGFDATGLVSIMGISIHSML